MSLFDTSIGDHSALNNWINHLGIKYNSDLYSRQTNDRGIGIFFKTSELSELTSDIELLRIPQRSTFNIHTLKEKIDKELDDADKLLVKKCLKIIVNPSAGITETNILIAYFTGLLLICKKRKQNKENIGWMRDAENYLNVLLNTKVDNLYSDHENVLQDFVSFFKGNFIMNQNITNVINEGNRVIVDEINNEFGDEFESLDMEEFLQLISAIRSRTLEIPREDIEDSDDYYVDITLVPVLDFVNHDNQLKNSYFDIDKKTQDIVLYLECDKIAMEKKEFEIFISYDMVEDLHRMFTNYGFIPKSEDVQTIIELPVYGYFSNSNILTEKEATERLIKISSTPNVQFGIKFDRAGNISEMKFNDDTNSNLIFSKNIEWDKLEDEEFFESEKYKSFLEKCEDEEEMDELILRFRNIRGFELYESMTSQEKELLENTYVKYLIEYFTDLKEKCKVLKELILEYELKDETLNILQLLRLYEQMSGFFLEFTNKKEVNNSLYRALLIVEPSENVMDSYMELRMEPIYNLEAIYSGAAMEELRM